MARSARFKRPVRLHRQARELWIQLGIHKSVTRRSASCTASISGSTNDSQSAAESPARGHVSAHRLQILASGVKLGQRIGVGDGDVTACAALELSAYRGFHVCLERVRPIGADGSRHLADAAQSVHSAAVVVAAISPPDVFSARVIKKRQPAERTIPCSSATRRSGAAWSSAGRGAARRARAPRRPTPGAAGGSGAHPSARCRRTRGAGSSARRSYDPSGSPGGWRQAPATR